MILTGIGIMLPTWALVMALTGLVANISSYLLTIPSDPLFRQSWKLLFALPALFWSTLKALTWMKRSRAEFLHTSHQLANV